ncbi:MAG TPA: apolipoprotein N-acyltransferase [Planctomycetaceae bacterium]|nr:apolipoprotein N-acyltransferase [Planctomycetaceae bacterium]
MRDRLQKLYGSTFGPAACGAVLYWAALPPLNLWPLAWIAPAWWILLARRQELSGRRPYLVLWAVGLCFWLAAYHFVRLPHPATSFGWIALAAYLGCYLPLFVALTRVAVHRAGVPLIAAAPVIWTGLELARAHLITGITMGALGHTQYRWIDLIQVSDLGGAYAVCFVMVFAAACLARMLPCDDRPSEWWPLLPAAAVLAIALVYGHFRMAAAAAPSPTIRVALIQGSIDAEFKSDPEKATLTQQHYEELTRRAVQRWNDLDLIVWPETMVRFPLFDGDSSNARPPTWWKESPEEFRERLPRVIEESRGYIADLALQMDVPMLLGVETVFHGENGDKYFNSAVLASPDGKLSERYDKMHRVLFGEYVPLTNWFPAIQGWTPLPVSLTAGTRAVAVDIRGVRLGPSICFETVLPHVIRRQIVSLRAEGREPDVLVNLTNDGWFRGSSELDMHLVCGVFRAVESRKPMLIAANTGFSAWIDADGRIVEQGPRRDTAIILATVGPDRRGSVYLDHGDVFAGVCLLACAGFGGWGLWTRRRTSAARPKHRAGTGSQTGL